MARRGSEEEPNKRMDAHIWLQRKEAEADKALTPGDHNKTRELLDKLKSNPTLVHGRKGRPPKKNKN